MSIAAKNTLIMRMAVSPSLGPRLESKTRKPNYVSSAARLLTKITVAGLNLATLVHTIGPDCAARIGQQ
jgi:hypothetical protein